jgi:serine/threonine protein kinase
MEHAVEDASGLCEQCGMVDSATLALDAAAVIDPVLGQSILQSLELPGYELLHIIGEGGMGAVVAARRVEDGAMVAVKVLPPSLSQNPSLVRRFHREADAMDKLRHPHIVGIIERGRSGPFLYFIMEYVLGPNARPMNLRQWCAAGLPTEASVLQWAIQIVDALGYAHAKGIVHRDIKPSNILLDEKGEAKVADFGVASATFDAGATVITRATSAVGTPLYMAPEQYADPKKIDHRVDVYSVGMVLYELLTGDLPLGVYEAPSHRRPGLNQGWDRIIGRALQSDQTRRFPDMASFRDALTRLENGADRVCSTSGAVAPEFQCPSCKHPVRQSDAVCRTCSHPLYDQCPECGATNTRVNLSCVACNVDLVPMWKVRRLWESADALLEKAKGEGEATARQQCAERAVTELTQASRLPLFQEQSHERLASAAPVVAGLSWRCAQLALEGKDLSAAMHYSKRTLAYAPNMDAAKQVLVRCEQRKKNIVDTAAEHIGNKRLKSAVEELQTGAMLFPHDDEIRAKFETLRDKVADATQAVRQRIPMLERANKYRELAVLIDRLERIGVPAKPIIDVKRRTYEALAKAEQLTQEARKLADTHTFNRARAAVRKALAVVSDDQDAKEVLASIDRHEMLLGSAARDIEAAMGERRWHHADELLDQVLAAAKELKGAERRKSVRPYSGLFVEIASKIDAGIHRSEVFRSLLVWTLGGAVLWLGICALVVALGEQFAGSSAVVGAGLAFLFGFLATLGTALAPVFTRKSAPAAKEAIGALFNGAMIAGAYLLVIRIDPSLLDGRFALWALAPWDRVFSFEVAVVAALAAAFLSTVVAGGTRLAIGAERRVGVSDAVGGLVVAATCFLAMQQTLLFSEAPIAVGLIGLTALVGPKKRFHDYILIASLGALAAVAVGAGRMAGGNGLLAGRLVEVAAACGMLAVAARKPWKWESIAPAGFCMALVLGNSLRYSPQEYLGAWMLIGLFLHATGVYSIRCREEWDPLLHLSDRRVGPAPAKLFGWLKRTPQSA